MEGTCCEPDPVSAEHVFRGIEHGARSRLHAVVRGSSSSGGEVAGRGKLRTDARAPAPSARAVRCATRPREQAARPEKIQVGYSAAFGASHHGELVPDRSDAERIALVCEGRHRVARWRGDGLGSLSGQGSGGNTGDRGDEYGAKYHRSGYVTQGGTTAGKATDRPCVVPDDVLMFLPTRSSPPSIQSTIGTVKEKVLPTCSVLLTESRPPCDSTSPFAMARPSPAPPRWLRCDCQKRSNT